MAPAETQPLLAKNDPDAVPSRHAAHTFASSKDLYGYGVLFFSAFFHATMTFLIHVGAVDFHFSTPATLVVRSCMSVTLSSTFLALNPAARQQAWDLTRYQLILLYIRGFFGAAAAYALYSSLSMIPVGDAVTIFFCSPAVAMVMSHIFLGEPITAIDCAAILISFAGVGLVSHPDLKGFGGDPADAAFDPSKRLFGVFLAICAAVFSSAAFTLVRKMGVRVHYMLSVLACGANIGLFAVIVSNMDTLKEVAFNRYGLAANVGSAIGAFGSQSLLNLGLQNCRAGPGIVVRSLSVPLSFVLGLIFLGEKPTIVGILGFVLVMTAIVTIGAREVLRQQLV